MTSERIIGSLSLIPKGEGRNFEIDGQVVAVFRTHGDEVFATQPECPHLQGPLADGLVGESNLICPLHDRLFDLRTGAGPDCSIQTYPARLTPEGMIVVALEAAREPALAGE